MEQFDSEKAARVWQRVRGEAAPGEPGGLAALAAAEAGAAAVYRQLARVISGPVPERLARDCSGNAAMLRGICLLTGVSRPGTAAAAAREPARTALRKSYAAALRAAAEYERRSEDPEYGYVFRTMAQTRREHCCRLLELLGKLK